MFFLIAVLQPSSAAAAELPDTSQPTQISSATALLVPIPMVNEASDNQINELTDLKVASSGAWRDWQSEQQDIAVAAAKKAAAKKAAAKKAAAEKAAAAKVATDTFAASGVAIGTKQQYAFSYMASNYGWTGSDQQACLLNLWNRESGWSTTAANASSGAYGIPQALPGTKMASVGSDWRTNYKTQIKWGLGYISGSYGSPCGAWAHSESTGWY